MSNEVEGTHKYHCLEQEWKINKSITLNVPWEYSLPVSAVFIA